MLPIWQATDCPVCERPFTEAEWDERHDGPNGEDIHAECCPTCAADHDRRFTVREDP